MLTLRKQHWFIPFVVASLLVSGTALAAGNSIEVGAGWQNMGAVNETLEWTEAVQGSRKDAIAWVGWRRFGESRFYWAPHVRLQYTAFWSLGGAGNSIGFTAAPAGIGVYLTTPPAAIPPSKRSGRWFVTVDVNLAALQIGGNVTPNSPNTDNVADPDAQRAELRRQVKELGGVQFEPVFPPQHYPFGPYQFISWALPVHIQVSRMINQHLGIGFYIESSPGIFEWHTGSNGRSTPAYGYNTCAGFSLTHF